MAVSVWKSRKHGRGRCHFDQIKVCGVLNWHVWHQRSFYHELTFASPLSVKKTTNKAAPYGAQSRSNKKINYFCCINIDGTTVPSLRMEIFCTVSTFSNHLLSLIMVHFSKNNVGAKKKLYGYRAFSKAERGVVQNFVLIQDTGKCMER